MNLENMVALYEWDFANGRGIWGPNSLTVLTQEAGFINATTPSYLGTINTGSTSVDAKGWEGHYVIIRARRTGSATSTSRYGFLYTTENDGVFDGLKRVDLTKADSPIGEWVNLVYDMGGLQFSGNASPWNNSIIKRLWFDIGGAGDGYDIKSIGIYRPKTEFEGYVPAIEWDFTHDLQGWSKGNKLDVTHDPQGFLKSVTNDISGSFYLTKNQTILTSYPIMRMRIGSPNASTLDGRIILRRISDNQNVNARIDSVVLGAGYTDVFYRLPHIESGTQILFVYLSDVLGAEFHVKSISLGHIPVTSISIDPSDVTVARGDSVPATVSVLPLNASFRDYVTSSENEAVATFDGSKIVGVGDGQTKVVANLAYRNYAQDTEYTDGLWSFNKQAVANNATGSIVGGWMRINNDDGKGWALYELDTAKGASVLMNIKPNTVYTLSFDSRLVSGSSDGNTVVVKRTVSGVNANIFTSKLEAKNEASRFSYTFNSGNTQGATRFQLQFGNSNTIGTVEWRRIKLEEGNQATDWNPALEDDTDEMRGVSRVLVNNPIKAIEITPSVLYVNVGGLGSMSAISVPPDAEGQGFKWYSSNTKVATVLNGEIKGLSVGSSVITVLAANGVRGEAVVIVQDPSPINYDGTVQNVDFSVNLTKAILWHHENAPAILSIVMDKQKWLNAAHCDFWSNWHRDVFNIDTANDFGLEVWGRILNIPMGVTVPSSTKKNFGFGSANKNFGNGNFGRKNSGQDGLTLSQKRLVIKMRYFTLTMRPTLENINEFLKRAIPDTKIVAMDTLNMRKIIYWFEKDPPQQLKTLLQNFDMLPRPATIGVEWRVQPRPSFGFGKHHLNFNNGNFGA